MISLAIFDFDWTLFRSPTPPKGTPAKSFYDDPDSLSPPLVPQRPSAYHWINTTVVAMLDAQLKKDTGVALITARRARVSDRIEELLAQKRLNPNFFYNRHESFQRDKSPVHFKRKAVLEILDFDGEIQHIAIWEDTQENIDTVKDVARVRRLSFESHLVVP